MTGINATIFYSGKIFEKTSIPANVATAIIMGVNFASAAAAVPLLSYFGRRLLLMVTMTICTLMLLGQALSAYFENTAFQLITCLLYVISFEFGPGPIVWIYMSEIMNDKGVAMGTFINWTFTLIFAVGTSSLFNWSSTWTFISFAASCSMGLIFVSLFIKETKGLTETEVFGLYRSDGDFIKRRANESFLSRSTVTQNSPSGSNTTSFRESSLEPQ